MKIVGFTQLRNELENGNIENFFKCMSAVCDVIYIFDQNSTDGSLEYYKKFNTVVINSDTNRFHEENICKYELLEKLKLEQPDTDVIMWMDGDEILDGRLLKNNGEEFKKVCENFLNEGYHACTFGHKNLWRSDTYERVDSQYADLDMVGACKLWAFSEDLNFNSAVSGLHQRPYPSSITNIKRLPYNLIHMGFSTDQQIISKYNIYKKNGQTGWLLDRLLDEKMLKTYRLNLTMYPDWYTLKDDVNPATKKKIIEIYNEQKH